MNYLEAIQVSLDRHFYYNQ